MRCTDTARKDQELNSTGMITKHIFGPVLSRRLGLSLGIDLIPFKTCTCDCVYCECGHTTEKTVVRKDFFPVRDILAELEETLGRRPSLDSVTLAGSGEPTLSLSLGPVIAFLKREYPEYTVSVLTNGSLMTDAGVRKELAPADRVIPTLTSASQATFERIHRPHPSLAIGKIIEGYARFRRMYAGDLWLEVFVIPGLNTSDHELAGLRTAIGRISPDLVQLNTLDRPPAEGWVTAAADGELERVRRVLAETGSRVAAVGRPSPRETPAMTGAASLIRATLSRRPSTVEDLVQTTGLGGGEVVKLLGTLEREGVVFSRRGPRGVFYTICQKPDGRDETA